MPTAEQIMAKMRRTYGADDAEQAPEPEGRTADILRAMRGETDYSDIYESNDQGRAQFEKAVRARAALLRGKRVPHAEQTARAQLNREAREKAEQESRRQTYDAMSQSSERDRERAKWEERANRPLRADGLREPGAPYVTPTGHGARRDRTSERLMAQANGVVFNLYDPESAGA
ncbi:hypothetical protein AB0H18_10660 [Streptomyces sp. NPDC020766]|uniref:hypothetical protein n=1 Tax=Streptomyces sp. NPDC020766 TaxID=3155011 RepID=UPI0033DA8E48